MDITRASRNTPISYKLAQDSTCQVKTALNHLISFRYISSLLTGTNSRIPAPNSYRAPPQGPLNMSTFQPRHPPVQQPLQMRGNPSLHLLQQQSPQQHDRNSPALIPPPSDSPLGGKPESAAPPSYGGRPTGLARYPTGGNGGGPMLAAPPPRHVQLMQGHVATPPQRWGCLADVFLVEEWKILEKREKLGSCLCITCVRIVVC